MLGPDPESVVTVGEVVIDLVAMDSLEDVEKEDISNELWQHYDDAEEKVVCEVSLSNPVALWYFCLVGEETDEDQCHGDEEER